MTKKKKQKQNKQKTLTVCNRVCFKYFFFLCTNLRSNLSNQKEALINMIKIFTTAVVLNSDSAAGSISGDMESRTHLDFQEISGSCTGGKPASLLLSLAAIPCVGHFPTGHPAPGSVSRHPPHLWPLSLSHRAPRLGRQLWRLPEALRKLLDGLRWERGGNHALCQLCTAHHQPRPSGEGLRGTTAQEMQQLFWRTDRP